MRNMNSWGDWCVQCSVSCGSGLQRRAVRCSAVTSDLQLQSYSHTASPSECSERPPANSRPCRLSACPSPAAWSVGPWSEVRVIVWQASVLSVMMGWLDCSVLCSFSALRRAALESCRGRWSVPRLRPARRPAGRSLAPPADRRTVSVSQSRQASRACRHVELMCVFPDQVSSTPAAGSCRWREASGQTENITSESTPRSSAFTVPRCRAVSPESTWRCAADRRRTTLRCTDTGEHTENWWWKHQIHTNTESNTPFNETFSV